MGGSGSREVHHYHTEYRVPPATQQLLDQQKAQLAAHEKQAMERKDPKLYKSNAENLFRTFVAGVEKLELTDLIKKAPGERHVGFIGPISSGKTTLINVLWNKQLPVALGHCTNTCEVVHRAKNLVIWDVAGQNDDYKFYDANSLAFVKSLDLCVVLFDNDIAMISNVLRIVHKLNPKAMIVVRTKVDQHNASNIRTVAEEKQRDAQQLKQLLGADINIPTLCISSHNVSKGGAAYDWCDLRNALH